MTSFSVFVPVYNGSAWLPRAIESVLAQTHQDWELIVGDNASDEDLASIVRRYADARIRYRRWPTHVDIFANFNRTQGLCRHGWVLLLPVDDRLHPRCLEIMEARIQGHARSSTRLAMIVSAARRIDATGQLSEVDYYGYQGPGHIADGYYSAREWLLRVCAPGSPPWDGGAYNREIIAEMGAFFAETNPTMSADLELALRISAYGDVAYIDEALMDVTGWPESHTQGRAARNRSEGEALTTEGAALLAALEVHERLRVVAHEERAAVRAAVARSYLRRAAGHRYRPGGRGRRAATEDIVRAVRHSPKTVLAPGRLGLALVTIICPRQVLEALRRRALASRRTRSDTTRAPASCPTVDPRSTGPERVDG